MLPRLARFLGEGLLSGLAGTALMTLGQEVEIRATGRDPSLTPAKAAEHVLDVEPLDDRAERRLGAITHWAYGAAWGLLRPLLLRLGLRAPVATATHATLMWAAALALLPRLGLTPPARRWGAKALALDLAHHVVYALGAAAGTSGRRAAPA